MRILRQLLSRESWVVDIALAISFWVVRSAEAVQTHEIKNRTLGLIIIGSICIDGVCLNGIQNFRSPSFDLQEFADRLKPSFPRVVRSGQGIVILIFSALRSGVRSCFSPIEEAVDLFLSQGLATE